MWVRRTRVLQYATNFREFTDSAAKPRPCAVAGLEVGEKRLFYANATTGNQSYRTGPAIVTGMKTPTMFPVKNGGDAGDRLSHTFGGPLLNFDAVALMAFSVPPPVDGATYFTMLARLQSPLSSPLTHYQFNFQRTSSGNGGLYYKVINGGALTLIGPTGAISCDPTFPFYIRINLNGSAIAMKLWNYNAAEPGYPTTYTDTSIATAGGVSPSMADITATAPVHMRSCSWFAVSPDPAIPAPLWQGA
jgi:hypothetical protein